MESRPFLVQDWKSRKTIKLLYQNSYIKDRRSVYLLSTIYYLLSTIKDRRSVYLLIHIRINIFIKIY